MTQQFGAQDEWRYEDGLRASGVTRFAQGQAGQEEDDSLASEVPVVMEYNGIAHAVLMATPCDLEDFARGFTMSANIAPANAIYGIDLQRQTLANGVAAWQAQIELASADFSQLKQQRRSMSGNTGCGVCGLESLRGLDLDLPQVTARGVSRTALQAAAAALPAAQVLNQRCGAMHAAAWFDAKGNLQLIREDVGRHNALDKLIGAMAQKHSVRDENGFCLMSSRASYELIQKAARAGISILATVSAPTALAAQLAQQAGLCLLGFVRGAGLVCYAGQERVGA
ncbi:formate dehydrogenase accessory sulfurtransferase FdhD [Massilia sp. W12]|uniref:formate dehydrogenase accessory sulfurtransferase FdhD n=1 Tax=Massilia sp. W12 TaxID=3126507 RepID=UPI0030D30331